MDISKYIINNIGMLDRNTISVANLTNKLCIKICQDTGIERDSQLEANISDILTKYKNKEITSTEVVGYFNEIMTSSSSSSAKDSGNKTTNDKSNVADSGKDTSKNSITDAGRGRNNSSVTENNLDITSDVDTDIVLETSSQCESLSTEIDSADIEIPSLVATYASAIKEAVNSTKKLIEQHMNEIKAAMLSVLSSVSDVDNSIPPANVEEMSFGDINKIAYDRKYNSEVKKADASFFKACGCEVDGNIVILNRDGKEYKYDLSSGKLTFDDGTSINVTIYVPQGAKDYSKLNTFTYFTSSAKPDGEPCSYNERIDRQSYSANAIILKIDKKDVGGDKFNKLNQVAGATKFVNSLAKTDLKDGHCRNIIGGDSAYGSNALKVAANSGDLYKTVYCVNNAVCVNKALDEEGNVTGKNKVQLTPEEVKLLDRKDIYFINVPGDGNQDHNNGNGQGWVACSASDSYTITGLKYICEKCPHANIHVVFNDPQDGSKDTLVNEYKKITNNYTNCTYDSDKWYNFSRSDYRFHTGGNKLIVDLLEADTTNCNYYFN